MDGRLSFQLGDQAFRDRPAQELVTHREARNQRNICDNPRSIIRGTEVYLATKTNLSIRSCGLAAGSCI